MPAHLVEVEIPFLLEPFDAQLHLAHLRVQRLERCRVDAARCRGRARRRGAAAGAERGARGRCGWSRGCARNHRATRISTPGPSFSRPERHCRDSSGICTHLEGPSEHRKSTRRVPARLCCASPTARALPPPLSSRSGRTRLPGNSCPSTV